MLLNWQLSHALFILIKEHRNGRISATNFGKWLTIWFWKTILYSLILCMPFGLKSSPTFTHALVIYEQSYLLFYTVYLITSWGEDKKLWVTFKFMKWGFKLDLIRCFLYASAATLPRIPSDDTSKRLKGKDNTENGLGGIAAHSYVVECTACVIILDQLL